MLSKSGRKNVLGKERKKGNCGKPILQPPRLHSDEPGCDDDVADDDGG